jgi:hypothetical protein
MPSHDSDAEFDAVLREVAAAPAVAVHRSGLPAPGTRLANRFIVERCLGEGGMGVVFEALDEERGERVALKTLGRFDGASVYDLKREFRSVAGIAHPNLVRLHELFEDGVWFFTMARVEGESFYSYVRPGELAPDAPSGVRPGCDPHGDTVRAEAFREQELRCALVGLVRGVCAIHRASKIHRDLKPGNVLVDRAGHVTILDFGLAQAQTGDTAERSAQLVAGTPAYMAPEQLAEGGACPASDWYAVGVMLYEALTGRLPFSGSTHEVLAAKIAGRAVPDPREVAPRVPDDLAELALALTRAKPDDRPSAAEITKRVDGAHPAAPEPPARARAPQSDVFVGREAELEGLRVAFEATRGGVPSIAYVAGVSGIGKSALVERFVERIGKEAVVLKGRCYERESVPFKALDAVIDALSRYLRNIGDVAAAAMAPRALSELCRVFPVLSRVPGFTRAMSPRALTADPQEVRLFAFGALKELFVRLADRRALVIVIDDMQWGDADSGLLLSRILAPPDPPPLLLIGCYRSDEAARTPLLRLLRDEASRLESCRLATIEVAPLEDEAGRTLAARLLPDRGEDAAPELVACIAAEASGNPFFIAELARRAGHMGSLGGHESLAALVQARVRELPETARRLLEIVAIAGGPLSRAAMLRSSSAVRACCAPIALRRCSRLGSRAVLGVDEGGFGPAVAQGGRAVLLASELRRRRCRRQRGAAFGRSCELRVPALGSTPPGREDGVPGRDPCGFLRTAQQYERRCGARVHAERTDYRRIPHVDDAEPGGQEDDDRAHHRQPGLDGEHRGQIDGCAHEPQQQRRLERLEAPAAQERRRGHGRRSARSTQPRDLRVGGDRVVPVRLEPASKAREGELCEDGVQPREGRPAEQPGAHRRRQEQREACRPDDEPRQRCDVQRIGEDGQRRASRRRAHGDVRRVGTHDEPLARDGRDDAVAHRHAAAALEQQRRRRVGGDESGRQGDVERLACEAHREHARQGRPVAERAKQARRAPCIERHPDRKRQERRQDEGPCGADRAPRRGGVRQGDEAKQDAEGDGGPDDLKGRPHFSSRGRARRAFRALGSRSLASHVSEALLRR